MDRDQQVSAVLQTEILANRTLASPTLAAEVAKRIGAGGATFHVVVPGRRSRTG